MERVVKQPRVDHNQLVQVNRKKKKKLFKRKLGSHADLQLIGP